MSPHFLGVHLVATCPRCGVSFPSVVVDRSRRQVLVCPNCGNRQVPIPEAPPVPAETVSIRETRNPERWEAIAFQQPGSPPGIKRLVGLPGESLRIRDGNLYLACSAWSGWKLLKKSFAEQVATRILVHDSKFSDGQPRWLSEPTSDWCWLEPGWTWEQREPLQGAEDRPGGPGDAMNLTDWLRFQPRRCYAHNPESATESACVEDSYGFNQALTRDLNTMDELMVQLDVQADNDAILVVAANLRGKRFAVTIDVGQRMASLTIPGEIQPEAVAFNPPLDSSGRFQLEFSTIDHQILALIDGQKLFVQSIESGDGPVSDRPLAVAIGQGKVEIERIRVWRDLYYLPGFRDGGDRLDAGDGFLLLGDNVPVSFDSRMWPQAALDRQAILGVVSRPDGTGAPGSGF